MKSQNATILRMMQAGWVTPLVAYRRGIFRLSARVYDLREQGHKVEDRWQEHDGKRFKAYRVKP